MNITNVLAEYDSLFGNTTLTDIETYLYEKIKADSANDLERILKVLKIEIKED